MDVVFYIFVFILCWARISGQRIPILNPAFAVEELFDATVEWRDNFRHASASAQSNATVSLTGRSVEFSLRMLFMHGI